MNDDVARVEVTERRETAILQEEQGFEDLTTQSLDLEQRQSFRTLSVLVAPVVLPPTLQHFYDIRVDSIELDDNDELLFGLFPCY